MPLGLGTMLKSNNIVARETYHDDIAKRMLGEDVSEVDETITDMVGEITNMVTGGAKNLLLEQGYDFDLATPVVVAGKDHVVKHKSSGAKVIMPFTTDAGQFFVEICFEE